MPLCPPQTPHAARTRTRAAAVRSQRLTALATARPGRLFIEVSEKSADSIARAVFSNFALQWALNFYKVTFKERNSVPVHYVIHAYRSLSIYLWRYSPFVGSWPLFQFLNPTHIL
jgi:hypothetical protein